MRHPSTLSDLKCGSRLNTLMFQASVGHQLTRRRPATHREYRFPPYSPMLLDCVMKGVRSIVHPGNRSVQRRNYLIGTGRCYYAIMRGSVDGDCASPLISRDRVTGISASTSKGTPVSTPRYPISPETMASCLTIRIRVNVITRRTATNTMHKHGSAEQGV